MSATLYGRVIVHRSYRLSRVRHTEPFSKSKAGLSRRSERRVVREKKETVVRRPSANDH